MMYTNEEKKTIVEAMSAARALLELTMIERRLDAAIKNARLRGFHDVEAKGHIVRNFAEGFSKPRSLTAYDACGLADWYVDAFCAGALFRVRKWALRKSTMSSEKRRTGREMLRKVRAGARAHDNAYARKYGHAQS